MKDRKGRRVVVERAERESEKRVETKHAPRFEKRESQMLVLSGRASAAG